MCIHVTRLSEAPLFWERGGGGVSCACANVLTARNTLLLAELRINTV